MKLWGGRFETGVNEQANDFHSSLAFDKRLYKQDIKGSMAHAEMLGKQGIIPKEDATAICASLAEILADIESGALQIQDAEDIHSFMEAELTARIGKTGGRLHTGRSRNDQVALDMRMYVKDEIDEIKALLFRFLQKHLDTARDHVNTIMPSFTHLKKAQPITLAHHIMAYLQMFRRDYERLEDCRKRVDIMPLGSGALAATVYPIDREFVRERLGFSAISENSLDAVSDRDFCIELVAALSIIMTHLSRFCEEIIIWASEEFSFVTVSDAYSTGSSIMPQKKNPDMAELIRGKTGRVYGNLMGLLTMMKSLPLAYNKDMQEDKEAVFNAIDTTKICLAVFTGMFEELKFNKERMYTSACGGYTNATDAADWLVKKGVTFREAHEIIGKLVLYAIGEKKPLGELSLGEFKKISELFDETIYPAISAQVCVNARNIAGGPAESAVNAAIANAEKYLEGLKNA